MTHTPGPWKVTADKPRLADNPRLIVEDDIGNPVCAMSLRGVYGDTVKMTANAHLIAAAPEMLAVLEKLSSLLVDSEEYVPLELREELTTAIRKARGFHR